MDVQTDSSSWPQSADVTSENRPSLCGHVVTYSSTAGDRKWLYGEAVFRAHQVMSTVDQVDGAEVDGVETESMLSAQHEYTFSGVPTSQDGGYKMAVDGQVNQS